MSGGTWALTARMTVPTPSNTSSVIRFITRMTGFHDGSGVKSQVGTRVFSLDGLNTNSDDRAIQEKSDSLCDHKWDLIGKNLPDAPPINRSILGEYKPPPWPREPSLRRRRLGPPTPLDDSRTKSASENPTRAAKPANGETAARDAGGSCPRLAESRKRCWPPNRSHNAETPLHARPFPDGWPVRLSPGPRPNLAHQPGFLDLRVRSYA